jgi:hypothetical protein
VLGRLNKGSENINEKTSTPGNSIRMCSYSISDPKPAENLRSAHFRRSSTKFSVKQTSPLHSCLNNDTLRLNPRIVPSQSSIVQNGALNKKTLPTPSNGGPKPKEKDLEFSKGLKTKEEKPTLETKCNLINIGDTWGVVCGNSYYDVGLIGKNVNYFITKTADFKDL